jgi:hypothetical protein
VPPAVCGQDTVEQVRARTGFVLVGADRPLGSALGVEDDPALAPVIEDEGII